MDWTERAWLAETLVLTIVFERLAKVRTGVLDQLHWQADQHQEGFLCGALPVEHGVCHHASVYDVCIYV